MPPANLRLRTIRYRARLGAGASLLFLSFLMMAPHAALALICCNCHASDAPTKNICLTGSGDYCTNLIGATRNPNVAGFTCEAIALDTNHACQPRAATPSQAVCDQGPMDVAAYGASSDGGSSQYQPTIPELNVKIPGLNFATQLPVVTDARGEQALAIPFLAQYISAVYKYLLGVSVLAAAIMVVYGGFRYIIGATLSDVMRGKEIIKDAIIGLILLFGSYTILQVLSPSAAGLKPLQVSLVKPDPFSYMGAAQDAPVTLSELGIPSRSKAVPQANLSSSPGTTGHPDVPRSARSALGPAGESQGEYTPPPSPAKYPTNLTIPTDCPGRSPGHEDGPATAGGVKLGYNKGALSIPLDGETIKSYLQEQALTGIPAAVLIAQMMTETGNNTCIVQNLFKNPQACGSKDWIKYNNFGGVGCGVFGPNKVPDGACANVAFFPGFSAKNKSQLYGTGGCDAADGPNPVFNKYSPACVNACRDSTQNTYANCGDNCYPQPSHVSRVINGVEVWYPSVQCSRKYKNAQEFLDSHLGFARYCLPYNDSVYKFAYCIGASTYAGSGLKGPVLAEIIERNCLCGSKDSIGCERDLTLEKNFANNVVKKRNLFLYSHACLKYSGGRCVKYEAGPDPDFAAIVKALQESTKGALTAHDYPQNDIGLPVGE